jgi:predicted metal-binding membrane protein
LFSISYLLVWGAAGLVAYGLFRPGACSEPGWPGMRAATGSLGGVLALAALYELTPLKHTCLGECRSPVGFLLGSWRDGNGGALEMGARHAAWCLGCCWALMAGLFALGIMSLTWVRTDFWSRGVQNS